MTESELEFQGEDRMAWFREARFGMFIHWGLYALLGRGEWAMNREQIPWSEYEPLFDQFNAENFNPREWAKLAKRNGMKYMVLTTKHHEGFCLWNSKVCEFNSVNSAAKRDCVAEFVEAVRAEGLKVGLYYSLGDWRNPDWEAGYHGDAEAKVRFMKWTHSLVNELVSNYGKIDIFWYDLPQNYTAEEWGAVELNHKIRIKQPGIIINNRAMTSEDFGTPEGEIKASQKGRMWEACMTLNGSWGYVPDERNYLSARSVAMMLFKCASGSGNLLLNVGPDGTGRIPEQSVHVLDAVGDWLNVHGEAVFNTTPHHMSWGNWGGPCSASGNILYIPMSKWDGSGQLSIGCLTCNVVKAEFLTTGEELCVTRDGARTQITGLPKEQPQCAVPVVKLTCDDAPGQDFITRYSVMDVFPDFP